MIIAEHVIIGGLGGAERAELTYSEPVVFHWMYDALVHCRPRRHVPRLADLKVTKKYFARDCNSAMYTVHRKLLTTLVRRNNILYIIYSLKKLLQQY